MKSLIAAGLLGVFPMVLLAQTPGEGTAEKATPPSGPLLNRAPDFTRWIVTYKAAGAKTGGGAASPLDYQASVTKGKGVYHLQVLAGANAKLDQWSLGDFSVIADPDQSTPLIFAAGANVMPGQMDFSRVDFQGLGWISRRNFVEQKQVGGTDCFIFRDRVTDEIGEEVEAEAILDSKSRLPMVVKFGERLTTYQYQAASPESATPPAAIAGLIGESREHQRRINLVPTP